MHRHQYVGRKFSRKSGPRKAMMKNLVSSVILYEKITTTLPKAKETRPVLEKLITKAKNNTLASRRQVAKFLSNNDMALEKLFTELGPLFKERNGGYCRIVKLGMRKGDGAEMAVIELLDTEKLTKKEKEAVKQPKKTEKKTTSEKDSKAKVSPKKAASKPAVKRKK